MCAFEGACEIWCLCAHMQKNECDEVPIWCPGLWRRTFNEIRVLKYVVAFNLQYREGNTRLWSI
jgi:hypothetical protein